MLTYAYFCACHMFVRVRMSLLTVDEATIATKV